MNEVWKYVINAGEQYEVSSYGRVRNATTKRVLRAFIGKDGYVRTQLGGLIRKTILVHREVAKAFLYKQDGKDFVNHIDGNKENNSTTNLEWCTRSENMRHAYDNSLISAKAGTKTEDVSCQKKMLRLSSTTISPEIMSMAPKHLANDLGLRIRQFVRLLTVKTGGHYLYDTLYFV